MPDPNEVGALWKKANDRGTYYSGTIDTDRLLELTGGETGKLSIVAYPVTEKANPAQPDLRLKFYGSKPKRAGDEEDRKPRLRRTPVDDDSVPF